MRNCLGRAVSHVLVGWPTKTCLTAKNPHPTLLATKHNCWLPKVLDMEFRQLGMSWLASQPRHAKLLGPSSFACLDPGINLRTNIYRIHVLFGAPNKTWVLCPAWLAGRRVGPMSCLARQTRHGSCKSWFVN